VAPPPALPPAIATGAASAQLRATSASASRAPGDSKAGPVEAAAN